MTTLYDTSAEVDTAEAERLLRRPAKQVRNLWRAGLLKGRMEQTVGGRPKKLWISRDSIEARLRDEARSPFDRARKGLSW